MFKKTFLIILAVAICAAEPPRFRTVQRFRNGRFLARQVAVPSPAPTGYPEAGVTPEVPFDLPTSTVKPDSTYLPPDNTYGPPQQPDEVYGPPEADINQPDNTYGPPDVTAIEEEEDVPSIEEAPQPEIKDKQPENPVPANEDDVLVAVAEDGTVIAVSTSFDQDKVDTVEQQSARLRQFYQRFPQSRRAPAPVPARLIRARKIAVPAKLQVQQPQTFTYTAKFQEW
ncbi:titin [Teleopsis dalmanni]|uniref:titin n=1 Tax=Teleopsis dalmanni TaxID=139649 RepID=UPI0018CD50A8|nr:titin [Teleopsis dalmanni]